MGKRRADLAAQQKRGDDEFYTQYSTVENELINYDFRGKSVLCNCNDTFASSFFQYFFKNFERLGIRKLVGLGYRNTDSNSFGDGSSEVGIAIEVGYDDKKYLVSYIRPLESDGAFNSKDGVAYAEACDIIVTNPPFSKFKKFYDFIKSTGKEFITMASFLCASYKYIFEDFAREEINFGYTEKRIATFIHPQKADKAVNITFVTNVRISKRNGFLQLTETYQGNESQYIKYDNLDAININKLKDTPKDYMGIMGVPITYLYKHNNDQFELVGTHKRTYDKHNFFSKRFIEAYNKKNGQNLQSHHKGLCYFDKDGQPFATFSRILIKRRI